MDKRLKSAAILAVALAQATFLVSCGQDAMEKAMRDILGKTGQEQGLPPSTEAELKEAIAEFRGIVEEKAAAAKRLAYLHKMLAIKYIEGRKYGLALAELEASIAIEPANSEIYALAGMCAAYVAKSKVGLDGEDPSDEAERYLLASERAYLRAIEFDPRSWKALYGISVLYIFELGRPLEAEPHLKAFLSTQTKDVDARFLLARVWYEKGMYREAIGLYDEILGITKLEAKRREAEASKAALMDLIGEGQP